MASRLAEKERAIIRELHDAVERKDVTRLRHLLPSDGDAAKRLCSIELKPYGNLLHHAAGIGDLDTVKVILDTGIDVNGRHVDSDVTQAQTALHIAALAGRCDVIDALLSRGADADAHESEGLTPLHCACSGNDVQSVRSLIDAGAQVNAADSKGQLPIQRSVLRSSDDVILELISRGADIHVVDEHKQTLLHYAVEWEREEFIQKFIESGLSPNARDTDGKTPLHLAENDRIRILLIQKGADADLRDEKGKRAIERKVDTQSDDYRRIRDMLEKQLSVADPSELPEPSVGEI
ncbi:hypothetical protein LSH36_74g05022 [Paralvinella palmiformis]|uniref:Ankyrin repeat protein n=1 Tax=Paralvinella palmiformis TaxID=53620 RepID=A0AAD9NE19_9ANNE|nr:hypothetical protein LSH36_74g05022 [Paralvinella palmiformis]